MKQNAEPYAESFREKGYFIHDDVISALDVDQLRQAIADIRDGVEVRQKRGIYGIRNLLQICPPIRSLAARPQIRQFVTPMLGEHAFAVRAIFFDKVDGANWSLGWHQDNVIATSERIELPGYSGWSNKGSVWHVKPPAEILANMIAVRVHLDDCNSANGPLRVIPGSHRAGWIEDLDDWKVRVPEVVCTVRCGGIVGMSPLMLHASARATSIGHRRVIHIEYAAAELPGGLDWNIRVGPQFANTIGARSASKGDTHCPC